MLNNYKRLEDESENHYIWRICDRKEEIGTWRDVADILNKELGHDYDESAYRKSFQYFSKIFLSREEEIFDDAKYIEQLKEAKEDLRRERIKLQATKLEQDRYIRHDARFELFYENIAKSIERIPLPRFREIYNTVSDSDWVLCISDMHYGANFQSTNNKYNRAVCQDRMSKLINQVIQEVNNRRISTLNIVNLGDDIQGILRMSDLQINDIAVVDAVVEVAKVIASFLNILSEFVNINYYHIVNANHSQVRPLGSKASELAAEDMGNIIAHYIEDLLRDNTRVNVHYDTSKDYLSFKVHDFNILAMHGHQVRKIDSVIKDMSNLHRTFYDYALLGHRHSANEEIVGEGEHHNIEVLTCPSIVGSDPFADKLRKGSKAGAKLFEFDKTYGHISSKQFILN